jgi:hypothetical protein
MNEKARTGRPRQVYEERDDGKNAERFDAVARAVLSTTSEAVRRREKATTRARAAAPVEKRRKRT